MLKLLQVLLRSLDIEQSFSAKASPYHNLVMESFFLSLKREELYRCEYHSVSEFKKRVEAYIGFYNMERPHSTLNYKTPNKHEYLYYDRVNTSKKLDKKVRK